MKARNMTSPPPSSIVGIKSKNIASFKISPKVNPLNPPFQLWSGNFVYAGGGTWKPINDGTAIGRFSVGQISKAGRLSDITSILRVNIDGARGWKLTIKVNGATDTLVWEGLKLDSPTGNGLRGHYMRLPNPSATDPTAIITLG